MSADKKSRKKKTRKKKTSDKTINPRSLSGFKFFLLLGDLFQTLRDEATERDKAGNRTLFYDQYALLLLLYYFNPTVDTLRGIQQFSTLEKVQKKLGVSRTSLGSLSEAARVFDPTLLEPIIAQLAERAQLAPQSFPPADQAALRGLVAVDGSLLRAVPRMAWALWQDDTHRAVKIHTAFSVWSQVPTQVSVTHGNGSERNEFRKMVEPGGFYVADRGYADYDLFREIDELGARFVIRVQENAVYDVAEENPISAAGSAAGVIKDVTLRRLGTEKHNRLLDRPLRLLEVQGDEPDQIWVLVTNQLEMSDDLLVMAYRYRWQVELFFRWLKCVLGCRRLISESEEGVQIQVYLAIIASLLMGMWIGGKPTKRGYEMVCHYLSGWASEQEVIDFMLKQQRKTGPPSK